MPSEAPRIGSDDISAQLDRLYQSARKHHLVAFFGTGVKETIETEHAGRFEVVPVRSELELRAELPPLSQGDRRIAYLVPWTDSLPLDISGRFARNGRVFRIGPEDRLRRMFGATAANPAARRSPLGDYLLATCPDARFPSGGGLLTLEILWSQWLSKSWGIDVEGGLALDTLLGWAAIDGKGPAFARAMEAPEATGVRPALLEFLRTTLGPAGPLTWTFWERGEGQRIAEFAVVFEALAINGERTPEVGLWLRQKAKTELGLNDDAEILEIAQALAEAASGALRVLSRGTDGKTRRLVVQAADGRLDEDEVRRATSRSKVLPSAWKARLDELGRALLEGASQPSRESVARASDRLRALETHEAFQEPEHTLLVKRATMATRLLAWLALRPDQKLAPSPTPYGVAEALGRWYAEQGGYVDWARRWARGKADSSLGRGAEAVVTAADEARKELDRQFARSLVGWMEAGRPSRQVLPIDLVVRKIVRPFLEGNPERRLLVLLMDGMAWAQAVELLDSLAERSIPWGRLAWHSSTGPSGGRLGEGDCPVVFANFPTLTEVSRSAFFAGKPMAPGPPHRTDKDPERWRNNKDVAHFFDGLDAPPLLLRSEGHTKAGGASREALTMVEDRRRRVVAMVVNAIDDSLKANPADRPAWTVDRIHALADLLEKARESGRSVLFASDHGHVPADRLSAVPSKSEGGGARWRPWLEGDAIAEHEVAFSSEAVWCPRGSKGVVMLADDTTCYGGTTHAGEHGGATLAEVVAPCLLIGSDEATDLSVQDDPALVVSGSPAPSWWHFEIPPAVSRSAESAAKPKKSVTPPGRQLVIPGVVAPSTESAVEEGSSVLDAFAECEILKSQTKTAKERRQVAQAVSFLVARKGVASAAVFAQAMGEPAFRVSGLVSTLQEVLNLDGYSVLRHVPESKQVFLDIAKLNQLFEVDL